MINFIEYVFAEVKNQRLRKGDAVDLLRQFQERRQPFASGQHPLLHVNTSDLNSFRFSSSFSGSEPFLADHLIRGEKVMPAVALLEMARAACEKATATQNDGYSTHIKLVNLVFVQPLIVRGPTAVHIQVYLQESGEIGFDIHTGEVEEAENIVCRGHSILSETTETPTVDTSALQAYTTQTLPAADCYQLFEQLGMSYGPAHRGLLKLAMGLDKDQQRFVVADLALPREAGEGAAEYVLHPSVMDAAFQAVIGWTETADGAAGVNTEASLPFAIEQVEIFHRSPAKGKAYLQASAATQTDIKKFDLSVCDENGRVCIQFRGFSLRALRPAVEPEQADLIFMAPVWSSFSVTASAEGTAHGSHRVLLCGTLAVPEYLNVIQAELPGSQVAPFPYLPADDAGHEAMSVTVGIFRIVQSVLQEKPNHDILYQIIVPHQAAASFSGLLGLLRTATHENPRLAFQLIMVEEDEGASSLANKLKENSLAPYQDCIRYRNGERQFQSWSALSLEERSMPWRDGGIYLIAGGGELGFHFAHEIAKNTSGSTLILASRSPLDQERQQQLDAIAPGCSVIEYKCVDVTDSIAVHALIAEIESTFQALHGVIHTAGVIHDNFLINKNEAEFESVLRPKVMGAIHLDQATRHLNLDFFVLFSSVAGALGNVGQADYAAANAFLDGFAEYRMGLVKTGKRQGKTLSLNWPLWASGGMRIGEELAEMMRRRMETLPLQTEAGIEAFYRMMATGSAQILVLCGDRNKVIKSLASRTTEQTISRAKTVPSPLADEIDSDWIRSQLAQYLKSILASTLKMNYNILAEDEPLENYGIDSIRVLELTTELEKDFGSLPKTLFFEYLTINALVDYFLDQNPERSVQLFKQKAELTPGPLTGEPLQAPALNPGQRQRTRRGALNFVAGAAVEDTRKDSERTDIAIIGLSGRYPGAKNVSAYWENLKNGLDCVTEIPEGRWDSSLYFDSEKGKLGKSYCSKGGFVDGVDCFDPLFFHISPQEAERMDPQERLFLQCVYEALEDAGYTRETLMQRGGAESRTDVAVFVGVMYEEYQLFAAQAQALGQPFALSGNPSLIANRVSHFFNFQGPSIALDTMCSSSLTAIHLACQSLRRRECTFAIAGGVNVTIHPNKYLALSQGHFVSSQGRCRSFGEGGDGYVPGEGIGAVLLKPLSLAIQDRDQIYGVIKGTAINHGGRTNGFSVPNPASQADVIERAIREAGIPARAITYIEAHGTGTRLGDPIEIAGLTKAFSQFTEDRQFCAIGSAKSNVGHCESAAGIAGLTKILLQMKHGYLAPSLHAEKLNPFINFDDTPFRVQTELAAWKRPALQIDGQQREWPRIAGLSSFGAGGSNAHVVIEEYVAPAHEPGALATFPASSVAVVLSARSEDQLHQRASDLVDCLEKETNSTISLEEIAYTLQIGREAMDHRMACIVSDLSELKVKLRAYLNGETGIQDLFCGEVKRATESFGALNLDEEMQDAVGKWIERRKYSRLLDLWVRGLTLDWNRLYGETRPRRISLPTYPFANDRHWIPDLSQLRANVIMDVDVRLHPLLHSNTSRLNEQRFSSYFTGEEFFFKDHLVRGARMLPGAAYLEMAIAAARISTARHGAIALKDVVWLHPFVLPADSIALHLALFENRFGEVSFEVYSHNNSSAENAAATPGDIEEEILYARGSLLFHDTEQPIQIDLNSLWACCSEEPASGTVLYDLHQALGISYGPAHRGVTSIARGADQNGVAFVIAEINLPAEISDTYEDYELHPAMIDSALHASLGWMEGDSKENRSIRTWVPFAMDELRIFSRCPRKFWVVIRQEMTIGQNLKKSNYDLCDAEGRVCVRISGFMARPIEKDAPYANGLAVPMQHDSTLTQAGAANFDVAFIDDVTKREEAAGIPVTENALQIATVAFLKNLLSSTLKVPAKLIRAESPLEEYGIDSVMVIQLTQELESTLGSLSKTLFFEYQTLGAVAKHLVENHRETLRRVLVPAAQPAKKISDSQPRTTSLGSSQSHASSHRSRRVSGFDVAPSRAPAKWQEIAIIGVAGRYPQANNLEEFWNNLRAGKDCISEIPSDRWDLNLYFDPEKGKLGKSYSKWGGFIDGVDHFDPLFFNISPREAEGMDPQERIFLQCAYHTLEDAGYTRDSLASYRASGLDGNVGVFVGVMYEEYQLLGAQAQAIGFPFALPGNPSSIANRVSYYLNLHGPSMALDTMCSSSLTAIHLACESLQRGGCEFAIAGGVNVSIHPNKYLSLSQGRFFSSLGRCESFGEGGDGFVPGEGVGAVLLKPLAAAIADGDRIQGVIKATAINHGGKTNGYSVPNPVAQASVIAHALDQSGIPPRAVSYIEAHGTGTKLGDPIEITGLCKAFAQSSNDTQFCTIGSAKSNIGHCESAAGIAGVTKVLLQMKHRTFVPSLHAETLNPNIDFTSSPFVVQRQESEWLRPVVNIDGVMKEYSRIAGVSSFGAGGSNAHILIEEYVADGTGQLHVNSADVSSVIILSARTEAQLVLQVENLIEFIEKNGLNNGDLKDIAYTLQVGREAMEHRLAIVATTMQMLLEKLRLFIAGDNPIEDLFHGVLKRGTDTTEMFQADEDLRRALEAWIEKDKLERLAEVWVKGVAFDWSRIHGVVKPRRIALPLYPFAQDRYWAIKPGVSLTSSSGVTVNGSAALHPLLQQNTSDFSEQRFVSVFNGQEFFLRDHQIGGTKVLPGVAYLEMARAAVQHSTSPSQWPARPTVNLRNIAWTHPFEVKDRLATLNIALHPEESGEITFEVFSDMERIEGDGAIKSISHAQGVIVLEEGEGAKSIDHALLRQCIEEPMDTKRFYDLHRSMGLHYGPAFQVVHSIAVGEDPEGRRFVLAELRLPQALVETRDQYGLHPSLLDGALHASLALFASEGSSGNDSVASASWLPFALDELSVLAPSPVNTWVVIRESSPLGSIVRKVDLQLCDETGGLWAEMKGFAARKLELSIQPLERQAVPVETSTAALEPMTFVEDWATALQPSPQKIELSTIVCFLSGNDGRYAAAEAISKQNAGARIIFIAAGESYFKASPHDYRVPQNDPASMAKALREVEIEHGSLNAMLYLWPLETGNLSDAHRPIQILIQAVAIARLQCPRILLAAQWENELDRCYVDSWVGFTRSLRLITPATHWSVIGCDSPREGKTPLASNMDRWIPRLWNELQNLPGSGAFYLDEVRHTLTLHPAMLLDARSPLRNHGTYLITGGAGGLGSLVAEYLARKYAANLVLTGRSQLDADKSMRIEELEQFGATVIYHAANVSDLQEMSVALDNARRRFGSIDGIIHCAGLQQEENILDSNDESFRKVLEPKIEGSLVLDELLKDEPLEFIVYFSSSSAVLGDFGACGYAIANRFQNAFARYQNQQARHGAKSRKTVAIDWPLWRDGGMSVGDDQMTELYLRSTGQRALEIEEGMQLFEKLLADPRPVHLVMAGDPARIQQLLGQAQGTSSASASRPVPRTNAIPTLHDPIVKKPQHLQTLLEPAIEFKMIDYLKTLLSSHLKLSFTLIAPDTPFEVFGIDSVIVMELTHELEKNLGSLSKTLFFEYSSIQTLASHLVRKYPGPVKEFLGVPRVPEADTVERNAQSITPPNGKSLKREHRSRFISDGKAPSQVVERANRDIAVIGLGGRYPKAENMDEFWANLKEGRDCVTEIPPDRWDHSLYFDPDRRVSGKSYSKWGGFIADVDSFDPLFFNINPFEARIMDPQERVFLETVWSLLENVGYTRQSMRERYAGKVGVYVGSMYHEYGSIGLRSAIANRVSYFFGFEGPSLVVDTMCSSSAVAVHNACVDLLNGDCRVAIAGGVNLSTHPIKYVSLSQAQLLGSHSDSRSFGQGDGYIPAEGVGAVLLKRLDHAIEDRDDIFAVIKATSINHGGRSNGYAIPNPNAQAQLIEDTLQKAGIDPRTISYVEAAANGSALGDPIELAALEKAFAIPEPSHAFCALGAVKSNLGHPEAASGMAQLSKVVLQMRHGQLVPSIKAEALNPNLKLEGSPFYLQRELTEWKRPIDTKSEAQQEHPRRAVLNSFGAGGSNACIVLEEFVSTKTREENSQRPSTTRQWPELVVLSAKNEEELRAVVDRMLTYLKRDPSVDLANLAYALQTSREAMNCRFATIVSTCEQLTAALEAYLGGSISLSQIIVHDIRSRSPIATLIEGKAGEAMLDTLVAERQLEKLALMWAHGAQVSWSSLPREGEVRIIALPSYPFAKVKMPSLGAADAAKIPQDPMHLDGNADSRVADVVSSSDTALWVQKTASVAPRTDLEITIASVWEETLGINGIGVNDSFLDLGGNSIQGGQIIAKLQEVFDIELPFEVLLGPQPTIAGCAVSVVAELLREAAAGTGQMDDQAEEAFQR